MQKQPSSRMTPHRVESVRLSLKLNGIWQVLTCSLYLQMAHASAIVLLQPGSAEAPGIIGASFGAPASLTSAPLLVTVSSRTGDISVGLESVHNRHVPSPRMTCESIDLDITASSNLTNVKGLVFSRDLSSRGEVRLQTSLPLHVLCVDLPDTSMKRLSRGILLSTRSASWRGAVQILSTLPTVGWVLLGIGESNKG